MVGDDFVPKSRGFTRLNRISGSARRRAPRAAALGLVLLGLAGCASGTSGSDRVATSHSAAVGPARPPSSQPSSINATPTPARQRPPQGNCPPSCDQIPDSAWIDPAAIPLDDTYRWAPLAPLSEPVTNPRFLADELCSARPPSDEERDGALAARVFLPDLPGQWRLRVQILHWRGDTYVAGQRAIIVMNDAASLLRNDCSSSAAGVAVTNVVETSVYPTQSLSATITDTGPTPRVAHVYLVADIRNSTVVELALSSSSPPTVPWPNVDDGRLAAAMVAPLCAAYVDSCAP